MSQPSASEISLAPEKSVHSRVGGLFTFQAHGPNYSTALEQHRGRVKVVGNATIKSDTSSTMVN